MRSLDLMTGKLHTRFNRGNRSMPTSQTSTDVLALIPEAMQYQMMSLEAAVTGAVITCRSIDQFEEWLKREGHPVVFLPATLSSENWWQICGVVNTMDFPPSILVYTLHSDFRTWSGILEAGGFDVIVAPFTRQKLKAAIEAAAQDYLERSRA